MLTVRADSYVACICASVRRYISPLTMSFQATWAILLASATATSFGFFRCRSSASRWPFVIASSKRADRNEVQRGFRQKHKGGRRVTKFSNLDCRHPAEKQVAVDPVAERHLRYRIVGKPRLFNNSSSLFQRPVSSTALRRFAYSRNRIPPKCALTTWWTLSHSRAAAVGGHHATLAKLITY